MKSLYQRQFIIMAGVILVSFALLGSAFIALSYNYTVQEQQDSILHNAVYVADVLGDAVTSDTDLQGFVLKAARVRPTLESVAVVTDATVLLATQDGQILFAVDGTGEIDDLANVQIPAGVVQTIQATGSFSAMSNLGGTFSENRYVAGAPFHYNYQGNSIPAGLVLIAAEAASLTEMWRAFASIFLFTSVVVMLIAFVTTSVTSLKMTRPLKDMAEAVRKFGHGEYNTRVDCNGRCDEVGELAEAFNAMADSISQAEHRRSEFVANISHELKTPMTTIAGFADGILDGTIPPEREREYLKVISAETRRLSRLVRKMLDLSRLQSAEYVTAQEQFDISEVMLRVLVSLETKVNAKHLDVDTQLPEDPVEVWGDPDAITQVCYNLLDNAIKFSYEESTLGISIVTRAGKAYVSVRNHGDTIPPEELPLVFDRFHKTDHSRSEDRDGVGLGLYIVKTILNNHKENITVTSQDGVTEFTFTLTLA
ncbi:MAG TPA: HAMP domain-containing histidine kinase [Candidatus Intestinimonas pullistercoris]|uniref:histidine kinase n=1 Tax=Candidatus Intestinimonas pullistercoris TaxID=2838623 RepID=A0A9D2NYR5_9FIRM|nr:HAMP domain-containing sensor histidine kinase [uncultured Intestinimonas sp.]HJC39938.1 HAMP domain-containing histidine kinase [Candidatus Intestinimonas pullistercoris]